MTQRARRFVGIIATILFMIVYVLAAMALAGDLAVGRGMLVELTTFAILGVAWMPVVMGLIVWMSRSGR